MFQNPPFYFFTLFLRFGIRVDITNAVQQQITTFTQGEENGNADGIRRLPHR
ncbi:hypothetical protein L9F63_000208 [Diploptera punctata]|uniref:Uncharacterized protein n=1 Tax=Diploptera punctata TaxID=6984 RepID=A0AAD8ESJ4_DIPPU|nr:hypothetical protein L9F63_000208 [Diploptera punctata]